MRRTAEGREVSLGGESTAGQLLPRVLLTGIVTWAEGQATG